MATFYCSVLSYIPTQLWVAGGSHLDEWVSQMLFQEYLRSREDGAGSRLPPT